MPGWIEVIIRSISLIVILFLMSKTLGKKQISQLNIFEYVSGIVLGSIVAIHTVHTELIFWHGLLAVFIWFIIPWITDFISLKSKRFRDFIAGKSTILIQNGKILEDNLKKERYTTDDLLENLREKNIFLASDVEFATLEPSGKLSVLPKREQQPITSKDLGIKLAPKQAPQTVIMDGEMLLEPLANLSLNPNWLETELDKMNVAIENVFLAQADSDAQLFVDLYDDSLVIPEPAEKALLLASMKKCQADLELFALATENPSSQNLYNKNSQKLNNVIKSITPYLE